MAATHGMSVEEVQRLGAELQSQSDEIRSIIQRLDALVRGVSWEGSVAQRFKYEWWPGHQSRLAGVATALHGFGQSAWNNATEQLEASGGQAGGRLDAYVVRSESYQIMSSANALIFSGDGGATVVMTEMSDGSYRIVMTGSFEGEAGIELGKLFKSLGMDVPVDLGVEVGGELEWAVEFYAPDEATGNTLRDALNGRASSITNRNPWGGVDVNEAVSQTDGLTGVQVEGVTYGRGSDGGAGGQIISGIKANAGFMKHRTQLPDGGHVVSYAYETHLGGAGWNADGQSQTVTVSTVYDAHGNAESVVVIEENVYVADTRGGGEKLRDTAFGLIPGLGYSNEESSVGTVVQTTTYDVGSLGDENLALAEQGEVARFRSVADGSRSEIVHERYAGSVDSSTRGVLFASSKTRYGDLELVSRDSEIL